jgi:hypothetical protein
MLTQKAEVIPPAYGSTASRETGIRTCGSISGLAAIGAPSTELVIWKRALPSQLRDWLNQIPVPVLPDLRLLIKPGELRPALEPLLDQCGMQAGDMRELLITDIAKLIQVFSRITAKARVDVRLERVDDDACWKFHRDSVDARLLTTYRGPTTEWVQPEHGERAILEQQSFTGPLEHLGAHDVAIFKGTKAGTGRGIVHRSPPIVGTGCTRLLLCLNEPTVASPDPWAAGPGHYSHAGVQRGW